MKEANSNIVNDIINIKAKPKKKKKISNQFIYK